MANGRLKWYGKEDTKGSEHSGEANKGPGYAEGGVLGAMTKKQPHSDELKIGKCRKHPKPGEPGTKLVEPMSNSRKTEGTGKEEAKSVGRNS